MKINIYRDGFLEKADQLPVVSQSREGHTVEYYTVNGEDRFFVTLKGSHFCAHGNTLAEAIADATWKDPKQRPDRENLKKEIQKAGKDRLITLNEFRLLTGACSVGCRVALKKAGKENASSMTAYDVYHHVDKSWGAKLIQILEWKLQ